MSTSRTCDLCAWPNASAYSLMKAVRRQRDGKPTTTIRKYVGAIDLCDECINKRIRRPATSPNDVADQLAQEASEGIGRALSVRLALSGQS